MCHNVRYAYISIRTICRIKVLSQELKCFGSKTTTVVSESTVPKIMIVNLYIFIVLD